MAPAIVYTTPTCGYCRQVKQFLGAQGIPFEERDVSRDRAMAEEIVRRTGQMGVPVTDIGGEVVIGFDRPRLQRIIERMRATRQPATLGAAVKDAPGGGALVGIVHPGTPADRGSLRPGDVIVAVDGTPVIDADTLARMVQTAQARGRAVVTVQRAGDRVPLQIPFAAAYE
ncbi:MAG TPA: glutaredoxin domain-containing protein [Chloroflexota bacterium]|nr:glutaredoxin domain-containing protein [Chloroflexota bacterium]